MIVFTKFRWGADRSAAWSFVTRSDELATCGSQSFDRDFLLVSTR